MDTKRVNIYAGSILGALLLFLLLGFFSNLIYHGPEHAGGEEEVLAYALEVQDTGEGADEPEEVNLAALAAEADPEAGEKVFNKCQACHSLEEGDHGVGPSLHGVVGDDIASSEGFDYSGALTGLEGDWDLESLSAFLENPQGYASGTTMGFAGLGKPEDRVNVIAYLNQASDSPVELVPEGAETAAAETETETETDAGEQAAEGEDAAGDEADQQAAAEEAETGDAAEGDAAQEEAAEEDAAEEDAAQEDATEEEAAAQDTAPAEDQEAAEETGEAAEEQETEQTAEEGAEEAAGGEFAELLANASAEEGEKVYRKCQACHTLEEGKHRVGPSLYGVIGSEAGSAEGYDYSDVMAEFGEDWTLANLDAYLENPNEFLPGNKMTFPGIKDAQDRIDVFTYIDQADGERNLPQ